MLCCYQVKIGEGGSDERDGVLLSLLLAMVLRLSYEMSGNDVRRQVMVAITGKLGEALTVEVRDGYCAPLLSDSRFTIPLQYRFCAVLQLLYNVGDTTLIILHNSSAILLRMFYNNHAAVLLALPPVNSTSLSSRL